MGSGFRESPPSRVRRTARAPRIRLVLWAFVLPALSLSAAAGPFHRFERLIPEINGASSPGVSSILQDRRGFLWFGTNLGLARYDGYRFDLFTPDTEPGAAPSPAIVYPVFQDGAGDIWIGTAGRGLFRFDREKETFERFRYDRARAAAEGGGIILAIQEDRKGDIWIGTRIDGLLRLDRDARTFTPVLPGTETGAVWDLLSDRDGRLWIGTEKRGLYRRDPATGEMESYRAADGPGSLRSDTVWTIFQDSRGEIWVGTSGAGLFRFAPESEKFVRFTGDAAHPRDLVSPAITALAEDAAGRLWIGTSWNGARVWDRDGGEYAVLKHDSQDPDTISDDNITSILVDASGVAWIGTTRGGINKCLAGAARFAHFKHDRQDPGSLGRNDVRSLDAAGPGRVWVGFDEGLDEFDERTGRLRSFRHDPGDGNGLGPGAVQAIHEDSRGRFWVGLAEGGLGLLDRDGGTVRHYRYDPANPESLSGNAVTAIASDRIDPDILWIGTLRGLNRLDVRTGKFRRYLPRGPDPAGLSGRAVLCLLEDSAETLWVGTRTGLNRVAKATGACETYVRDIRHPAGNGPFDNVIRCLYLDTRGILWIGTENGLNRFDRTRGEWRYYLPRDGLPGEVVCGILADGAGALWIGTNRGLARFDPGTETFTAFGTADGLQGDAFNGGACVKGADGRMRFGGINGYNVFRPEDLKPDPSVPPLAWTGFSRNNRKISAGGGLGAGREIRLTGRDRFVSFDFAALSYVDPPSNAFAYKLEPRDREWIDLGHERSVVLSGLRPGRHVLRVKGAGRNGVWNEDGLSLALSVASPFWRSGWFIGLAALLLASGAGAVLLMWTKLRTAYLQATPNVDAFIAGSGLTAREAEILRLILRGAGNKDIAAALFISTSTVRNHVYNMYRKLGVKSRIELVNRINAKAKRPTS